MIQEASTNELVEDTHDKRREDGEKDVVERQSPRFVNDFAGEAILEGILRSLLVQGTQRMEGRN
jgi:hypothetical protein